MGFPGTFARLKSRLSDMAGNQVRYGPNGPGNQAPGRSASILTFGNFWLTIQNTTNRHVNNAFGLLAVFISFPLARAAAAAAVAADFCCCCC